MRRRLFVRRASNFRGVMDAFSHSESEVLINRRADGRRGALAVLAAIAVMAVGAGLVGYAVNQASIIDAGLSTQPVSATAAAADSPPPAASAGATQTELAAPEIAAQPADAAADPQPTATLAADVVPAAEPAAEDDGLTPRLAPRPGPASPSDAGEDALSPRIKPSADDASEVRDEDRAAAPAETRLLAFKQRFIADPDERPPPVFFTDEIDRSGPSPRPLAAAYAGDVSDGPRTFVVSLAKGENFVEALRRAGVRAEDRNAAAYAFGAHYNHRTLRPGQEFAVTTALPNQTIFQIVAEDHEPEAYLLALDFKADSSNRVSLIRRSDGRFDGAKSTIRLTKRLVSVSGRIVGSLYVSAKSIGAPDKVIADLANVFAYDVDFQREIVGGDEFEAIFEARYDDDGRLVDAGDILYGRLKWRGRTKEKGYYLFASQDGGGRYFDRAGESAKRLLMKTPIDGARLSSGFGTRRHPISGYNKMHKGVDFAAPRGTPIKAGGDGVVERADRYGGYGNYVRIRHARGYKTAYAHLSGFAKGMRAGKRVEQGQTIGYVGSTGASTGPHLHYEILLNNAQVNPQKLKITTGVALAGADLKRFKAERERIDAMRHIEPQDPALLAQDDKDRAQL